MKLLYCTLLIGVANAALPPGYEDQMYCPPGNCQLYIHKKGFSGPRSAFNKCYDKTTGIITEGVWTGSKVDTVPPNDYIQPEKCFESERESSSVSPTPSPSMLSTTGSTSMATLEKIPAMCDSDDQCRPVVRGSAPHPFTGVGMCGCFAESDIDPFDQCEGDRESCATARCIGEDVDSCYEMDAYCDLAPDDNGMGECRLREPEDAVDDTDDTDNDKRISSSDDNDHTDTIIPAQCDSDDQCSAMIRSQQPAGSFTGVPACQCFASSYVSPFDQCEGSERCRQVRCVPGGCDGLEAYCDIAPNDNGMGQCQLRSTNSEESETFAVA